MKVQLVSGDTVVSEAKVAIAPHDQTQLVVGVVSENPAKLVGELKLLPSQSGAAPVIATLTPADLPRAHPGLGGPRPAGVAGRGRVGPQHGAARRHAQAGSPAEGVW